MFSVSGMETLVAPKLSVTQRRTSSAFILIKVRSAKSGICFRLLIPFTNYRFKNVLIFSGPATRYVVVRPRQEWTYISPPHNILDAFHQLGLEDELGSIQGARSRISEPWQGPQLCSLPLVCLWNCGRSSGNWAIYVFSLWPTPAILCCNYHALLRLKKL